ncbi:MAG: enolase C-terminal domain-like protein [Syntrophales bacterium]
MDDIAEISCRRIRRVLKTRFATALGSKSFLNSVMVRIELKSGMHGEGEIPTSFAVPRETIEAIEEGVRKANFFLANSDISEYPDRIGEFRRLRNDLPMTSAGLETALFRAMLGSRQSSEREYWGRGPRRIQTDITVPYSADRDELYTWLRPMLKRGFTIFKLKISGNPESDLYYLETVHEILKTAERPFAIRLDGNQSYGAETFLAWLEKCERKGFSPELVEQPLPAADLKGSAFVKKRAGIPIILDESVFRLEDLEKAIGYGSCDGVNIKIAKSGIGEAERLLASARSSGLKVMLGCMIETMTGLSASIFMAAGAARFDYLDLDSVHFIARPGSHPGIGTAGSWYRVEDPA